jgi:hypothetical protein
MALGAVTRSVRKASQDLETTPVMHRAIGTACHNDGAMKLLRAQPARQPAQPRHGRYARSIETTFNAEPRIGDTVVAQDGPIGRVERVVRTEARVPAYVVVVVRTLLGRRYPVVPWSLVADVDRSQARVKVRGRCGTIGGLPETLPLVV